MKAPWRLARLTLAVLLLINLAEGVRAQELVSSKDVGRFLESLYTQVANGSLNLSPFYETEGITISNHTCDPATGKEEGRACGRASCPLAPVLGLRISCLYDKRAGPSSDLLVEAPYPVVRLGDYDPEWNAFQFRLLESKLGGRMPLIGLTRMLAVPSEEQSGFFEFTKIEDTSNGLAQVDKWKAQAKGIGSTVCGSALCFSTNEILPAPSEPWGALKELIAECIRRKIGAVVGPPEYCTPIYLTGSRGTFVSALTSFRGATMKVSRGLIGARVFFGSGKSNPDSEAVAQLLERALASTPLLLKIDRDPDAVVGASENRASKVIPDWNETATVRAVMTELPLTYKEVDGQIHNLLGIRVGLAITLYVNNRNTDEWRMPTQDQSDLFETTTVEAIRKEADRECSDTAYQVRDSIAILSCSSGKW